MTVKSKSEPCKFKQELTETIKDTTGSGEDYVHRYYYCTMIKRRLKKRECQKCKR
jgi:hypothetical protein